MPSRHSQLLCTGSSSAGHLAHYAAAHIDMNEPGSELAIISGLRIELGKTRAPQLPGIVSTGGLAVPTTAQPMAMQPAKAYVNVLLHRSCSTALKALSLQVKSNGAMLLLCTAHRVSY